jgi:hypothetical protein
MVPPRTHALAGRGRKSASRLPQTRASKIASVTPAPLGILTATPRNSTGRVTTQEEQDAVRKLVEGPCEVLALSGQEVYGRRHRSRKGKEKALPLLNAPSRPALQPLSSTRIQTCHHGSHLSSSGNSPPSNYPTSPQISASAPAVRTQAPTPTSATGTRDHGPSPSSLESTDEAGPSVRAPTPLSPYSSKNPRATTSSFIHPSSTPGGTPPHDGAPVSVPDGCAQPISLSLHNGTQPICSKDRGKPRSSHSRETLQHQLSRHREHESGREPRTERQPHSWTGHAGHKHNRSASSHDGDLSDGPAITKKPSLTQNMQTIDSDDQDMMHIALRDFGALFGPRLIESFEARIAEDARKREAAAQARHAQTCESLASLRAGTQVDMIRFLDTTHQLQQDFGHLHRAQVSELVELRREKRNAEYMHAQCRQRMLNSHDAMNRTTGQQTEAMEDLPQHHFGEITSQREGLQTRLVRAEADGDEAILLINHSNTLTEQVKALHETALHRSQRDSHTREVLLQYYTSNVVGQRDVLTRERDESRALLDQTLSLTNLNGTLHDRARHRAQQDDDFRRTLSQQHTDGISSQVRSHHVQNRETDCAMQDAQLERSQAVDFAKEIQIAAANADHRNQRMAGNRAALVETHNIGLLGRMTAMMFGPS